MSFCTSSSYPVEVCTEFLSHSSVRNVWAWACAFKRGQGIAQDALRDRYRSLVRPFVDPIAFRRVLKENEAVISGSIALQFAEGRTEWQPHDMDVYVPFDNFWNVVQYLIVQEGYGDPGPPVVNVANNDDDEEQDGYGRMAGVFEMVSMRKGDRRVDVLRSKSDSALHPISYFWGTLVMNYLGADSFGCAYPDLTFSRKCLVTPIARLNGTYATERVARCVDKYEERGYEI